MKTVVSIDTPPFELSFTQLRNNSIELIVRNAKTNQSIGVPLWLETFDKMVHDLNGTLPQLKAQAALVEAQD